MTHQWTGCKKLFSVKAPTTTPMELIGSTQRLSVTITNNGTVDVFVGLNNTVSTTNGFPLKAGQTITDDQSDDPWWAVTASGTADIRIIEVRL